MSELPQYVIDLVNDIAKSEGFSEFSLELQPGSKHGDNFLGVMTSVTISGSRNNNGTVADDKIHLICKLAPDNVIRRNEFHSAVVFARESLMYNEILPLLTEFQKEKGLSQAESFSAYPKCYVAIADEAKDQFVVIMEDLRPKGFKMWPKQEPSPACHMFQTIEQLAKLHGVSFVLKDQRPDIYDRLRKVTDVVRAFFKSESMVNIMNISMDRAVAALPTPELKKIMEYYKEHAFKFFFDCLEDDSGEPFGVITHGDCWNNNILYRYKEGTAEEVEDICFVDWQLSRFASPVLDLHYNIFSCTDKAFRDKNYKNLMKHYHKSLSNIVTRLGSDPEKLFSYSDFENQLKKFGNFVFINTPLMLQIILADSSEIPDLDELSEKLSRNEENVDIVSGMNDKTTRLYNARLQGVVENSVEYGYHENESC